MDRPRPSGPDPLRRRPLWTCPACSRRFAHRNQAHACGRYELEAHFTGRPPVIRAIFDRFLQAIEAIGPVTVLPERTRIAFQVRMSFAQLTTRRHWVDGHLVLARPVTSPVFIRVESLSSRNHVHVFRLVEPRGVNAELRRWLRDAYAVGEQKHLQQERSPEAPVPGRRGHRQARRRTSG